MNDALTLTIMWALSLVASVSTGIAVDLWRKHWLLQREIDRLYDELAERKMNELLAKFNSTMEQGADAECIE